MPTTSGGNNLDFNDALHEVCRLCDQEAQRHRLSQTGNLYCMELNNIGKKEVRHRQGWGWSDHMVGSMPLRFLKRSPIDAMVGRVIKEGLTTYVTA